MAEVTITLKNEGYDAFKPSVFGKKIIITRRFTVQGASSYKICSEKKVLVSNKKAVLDDICDHMQIQVDNPLNVLTQGSFPLLNLDVLVLADNLSQTQRCC